MRGCWGPESKQLVLHPKQNWSLIEKPISGCIMACCDSFGQRDRRMKWLSPWWKAVVMKTLLCSRCLWELQRLFFMTISKSYLLTLHFTGKKDGANFTRSTGKKTIQTSNPTSSDYFSIYSILPAFLSCYICILSTWVRTVLRFDHSIRYSNLEVCDFFSFHNHWDNLQWLLSCIRVQ